MHALYIGRVGDNEEQTSKKCNLLLAQGAAGLIGRRIWAQAQAPPETPLKGGPLGFQGPLQGPL